MQPTVVAPGILAPPLPSCVTVGKVLPLTAPSVTVRGGGSSTAPWDWHKEDMRAGVYKVFGT